MNLVSFRWSFRIGCIMIAILTTIWPFYLFCLDDDLVKIEFKEFHSTKDRLYPALTLCFDSDAYYKYNHSVTDSLNANKKEQVFSNQTTLTIEDYIDSVVIKDMKNNKTRFTRTAVSIEDERVIKDKLLSTNIVLGRYQATSCFAVGIPFLEKNGIKSIDVGIKKSIFKNGTFPTRNQIISGTSQLTIALSYQNQLFPLLNHNVLKLHSNNLINNRCSGFRFNVRGMEILRRRNKPSNPCNDYDNENAIMVLNDAATRLGCMPSGWEITSILPDCHDNTINKSARQLLDDGLHNSNANRFIKPCSSFVDLWYDYSVDDSVDSCNNDQDTLHVMIVYNNIHFKEIGYYRAYTAWDLLSSISVIIGLFLGGSFLQLPDLFRKIYDNVKTKKSDLRYGRISIRKQLKLLIREIKKMKQDIDILKRPMIMRLQRRENETMV